MSDESRGPEPDPRQIMEAILQVLASIGPGPGPNADRAAHEAYAGRVLAAYQMAMKQEEKTHQIFEFLLDSPHPRWGFTLTLPSGQATQYVLPKRIDSILAGPDPQQAADFVSLWLTGFGLAAAPVLRSILMLHGVRWSWHEVRPAPGEDDPPKKPLIIIPGGKS